MAAPLVTIVMGSDSDLPVMQVAADTLAGLEVPCELRVSSAHRSPAKTRRLVEEAVDAGVQVFIVGAGAAAHLAGVIAAETTRPVVGVPLDGSPLKGVDALYSTVMMPGGIPVATMAIGKAGAKNGALFAAEILALHDPALADRLAAHRRAQADGVEAKDRKVRGG
jgi:phosphoribosylaminoimidazole carboxylase PurE protein